MTDFYESQNLYSLDYTEDLYYFFFNFEQRHFFRNSPFFRIIFFLKFIKIFLNCLSILEVDGVFSK